PRDGPTARDDQKALPETISRAERLLDKKCHTGCGMVPQTQTDPRALCGMVKPSRTDRHVWYKEAPGFPFAPAASAGHKEGALPLGSRRLLGRHERPPEKLHIRR